MYDVESNLVPHPEITTSNNLVHIFSDFKNADLSIYM